MLKFADNDKNILFELCKLPFENFDSYLDSARNLIKVSHTLPESQANADVVEVKLGSSATIVEIDYAKLFENGQNAWPREPYFICRRVI